MLLRMRGDHTRLDRGTPEHHAEMHRLAEGNARVAGGAAPATTESRVCEDLIERAQQDSSVISCQTDESGAMGHRCIAHPVSRRALPPPH